jgi:crotonobetainyl-CoA:carnitine CoA-transferase CaiB-like acyl-CoA transferase
MEAALQAEGIPAHRVLDTEELHEDEQLRIRNHFLPVSHKDFEGGVVESTRLALSRTDPRPPEVAPWFGIDNETVLSDLLGYGSDIIRHLQDSKVMR